MSTGPVSGGVRFPLVFDSGLGGSKILGELTTGAVMALSSAVTGFARFSLTGRSRFFFRSTAPADSLAAIWRRKASREAASAVDA